MNIEPQRDPKELFTKFKVNFEKKGAYLEFHFDKLFELLLISRNSRIRLRCAQVLSLQNLKRRPSPNPDAPIGS